MARRVTKLARPPGPSGGLFGIRHAIRSQMDILGFMSDVGRYGDLGYFAVGPIKAYVVNNPDLLREVLVTRADLIGKLPFQTGVMSQIEGSGMLVSEGAHWRKQRRLLQPAFQAARIETLSELAVDETLHVIEKWREDSEIETVSEMTDLSLAIMAKSFFGLELRDEAPEFRAIVRAISETFLVEMRRMVRYPRWSILPAGRRKWRAIEALNTLIWELVRRERGDPESDSLLAILLRSIDPEDGRPAMTEIEARDEAVTMFNSGHDTTAAALTWLLYLVASHPDVGTRIAMEIGTVIGNRRPRAQDTQHLRYVDLVVREALRLYPPGWSMFTRQALAGFDLGGYHISKGSWLIAMPWVTHRDGRYFADPLRFDPDRFSPERVADIPRFAYFPFGIGEHSCIGMKLAMSQLVLIAAAIFQRFRLRLARPESPLEIDALLSIWPRGGLRLVVERAD